MAGLLADWPLCHQPGPRAARVVTGGAPHAVALHGRAWGRAGVVVQSGLRLSSAVLFYLVPDRGGPYEWLGAPEPGPSLRRSRCCVASNCGY